ncbi:MAG: phospholipase D family protein [Halioglobus sp.]
MVNNKRLITRAPFFQRLLLTLLIACGTGCATVDFDAAKPASHALTDTANTYLGKLAAKHAHHPPKESGFYLVTNSIDALAIRLMLAERAERSIDAQYYMIDNDIVGKVFFSSLLRAADRGVRVRLLIDDINTADMEHKLAALADHPNIELRLFNPFANRTYRAFSAWDFQRVNRRMHNKSLTMDNQITIIGGRNIATEYFAANSEYNFGDLDTLAVGPVVNDTSRMFDAYWNHRNAIPYVQLSGQKPDDGKRLDTVRKTLEDNIEALRDTPYADALLESLDDYTGEGGKKFTWAPYQLVYDSPDKSLGSKEAENAPSIVTPLARTARSAKESLLIISPYFVPRSAGIKSLTELQDSGVQVDIVTNSLASSDHILVHGGYAACRKPLLEHGVRLFEVRGDNRISGTKDAGTHKAKSSLHAKIFIVDERYFFMGSFNWDPRSARINTELGIIIDSPEISAQIGDLIYATAPKNSYEVFLNENGSLRWKTFSEGPEVIYSNEPDTSFFTRLKANLGRALPIRGQL